MYGFIDTTEQYTGKTLPAEALQLNGEYLENLIEGYRTLTVQGREALSGVVATDNIGLRAGSLFRSRRYPERIITVRYQLICDDAESFRTAYNKLAGILDIEEGVMVFADEPDKYFVGIPGTLEDVEPGRNAVVSSIQFVCPDPFKYSVEEHEAQVLEDGTLFCDYHGTFPSHPTLSAQFLKEGDVTDEGEESTITGNGDCGYIAFFDSDEHVLQFGDPEEEDVEKYPASQTLLASALSTKNAWTNAVKAIWPTNTAAGVVTDGSAKTGTAGMIPISLGQTNTYYVGATSYGTGTGWHGPCISAAIPADKSGDVGADNWEFQYAMKFANFNSANGRKTIGEISCYLSDANGYKVVGVRVRKTKAGETGEIAFIVNNVVVDKFSVYIGAHNQYFGNVRAAYYKTVGGKKVLVPAVRANRIVKITKAGTKLTISAGGITRTYTRTTNKLRRITFHFKAWNTSLPISYGGIYNWKFVKLNCTSYKDVPNKFTANDLLEIDTGSGDVLLNGDPAPGLGSIGNQWEEFVLLPGENQLGWSCSDWCTSPPVVGMKYREVYL